MTRSTLRRYPALGFLAAAALLASLLPSALRVPLSGPSASAELAPVPGKSDSAQGDLSALGQSSTGGLGSGGGLDGLGGGARLGDGSRPGDDDGGSGGGPPGGGRNPSQKRCVGNPPRQTEDPLSPPCVAYFKGDNGGATAKGVTADEIVIVSYEYETCSDNGPEFFDYDDTDDPRRNPVKAAYVRYFNDRFQTYGRRVHLYGAAPQCNGDSSAYLAFLQEIEERYHPFFLYGNFSEEQALQVARTGTFVILNGPKRSVARAGAPFVLSYRPDLDNHVESAAEFLCARLAGRPARFALDPSLRVERRKFGLLYDGTQDHQMEGAGWFLDRVRTRCGDAAGEIVRGNPEDLNDYAIFTAKMRAAGVTTVVAFWGDLLLPSYAESQGGGWHPEWFLPDMNVVGDNYYARTYWGAQASSAFGIISNRRLGLPAEQPHRRAWREGCACGQELPPELGGAPQGVYDTFLLLFTGIQAAGPHLTPANLDKGLHALPARQSLDSFTPAAYFAPGNYSFVKDWAAVWWDPAGRPPGSRSAGCWRLVEDGLRYRAEDWQKRPGDEGIQQRDPEQPCQADL